MKTALQCAVMLVVVLIGAPGYPVERLALYDDFNAVPIDPDKWFGIEFANMAKTSLTSAGSSADSRAPLLRWSLATGHAAEILDEYGPYVGYDPEQFP